MTLGANFFILNLPAFATKNTRFMVVSVETVCSVRTVKFSFGLLCPERIYFFQINPNMISYLVVFYDRLFRNDYIEGPIDLMR